MVLHNASVALRVVMIQYFIADLWFETRRLLVSAAILPIIPHSEDILNSKNCTNALARWLWLILLDRMLLTLIQNQQSTIASADNVIGQCQKILISYLIVLKSLSEAYDVTFAPGISHFPDSHQGPLHSDVLSIATCQCLLGALPFLTSNSSCTWSFLRSFRRTSRRLASTWWRRRRRGQIAECHAFIHTYTELFCVRVYFLLVSAMRHTTYRRYSRHIRPNLANWPGMDEWCISEDGKKGDCREKHSTD